MKRHCPRCGKPEAIVVTTKTHDSELGKIDEENWRCEDCFFHFKIHSPIWGGFWILAGLVFFVAGVMCAFGFRVEKGQEALMAVILCSSGIGAFTYGVFCKRAEAKARPVR